MRVAILGAGGVGSVVAGYLARSGVEVTMIGRPGHVAAVQRSGLYITGLADFYTRVNTAPDAGRLSTVDVLLVTVKTKDMRRALESVVHLDVGGVASLQNGVVKNEQLARVFGWEKVIGATTMIGATLVRHGVVAYTLDGISFFGPLDNGQVERTQHLVRAFIDAGLNAAVAQDIVSIEWTKQAIQNPFAPLAAMSRLPVHLVWSSPHLAALSVHMFREVAAVAEAKGIQLSEHPAWSQFSMKILREAAFDQAVDMIVRVGQRVTTSGHTQIIPSMLQDVLAGKQTEIEETVGHVFHEGQRLGIPVPYTEFAYRAVKAIEADYQGRVGER